MVKYILSSIYGGTSTIKLRKRLVLHSRQHHVEVQTCRVRSGWIDHYNAGIGGEKKSLKLGGD
jgi:hypothetical protein